MGKYSVKYLKLSFIAIWTNEQSPMSLFCQLIFLIKLMSPSRLSEYFTKEHVDLNGKDTYISHSYIYWKILKTAIPSLECLTMFYAKEDRSYCFLQSNVNDHKIWYATQYWRRNNLNSCIKDCYKDDKNISY